MSAVSLEVYTEMLAEEIAKLKGEQRKEQVPQVTVDLGVDARLSPTYIQDDDVRINFYGRLAETINLAEVSHIAREMREAYGPFPPEVKAFVDLARLRLLASSKGVATIKEHMTDVQLSFDAALETLDYDAKRMKGLAFSGATTTRPASASKRVEAADIPGAIMELLYLRGEAGAGRHWVAASGDKAGASKKPP